MYISDPISLSWDTRRIPQMCSMGNGPHHSLNVAIALLYIDIKRCCLRYNCRRVDLFITCASEDIETIVNTAEAVCAHDYPAHFFRITVLNDAGSKGLS